MKYKTQSRDKTRKKKKKKQRNVKVDNPRQKGKIRKNKSFKTYRGQTQASDTKRRKSLLLEIDKVDHEWVKMNKKTVESGELTPKFPSRIQANPTPGTSVLDEEDPM